MTDEQEPRRDDCAAMHALCAHCVAAPTRSVNPATRRVGNLLLCKDHWTTAVTVAQVRVRDANEQLERLLNAARVSDGELIPQDPAL